MRCLAPIYCNYNIAVNNLHFKWNCRDVGAIEYSYVFKRFPIPAGTLHVRLVHVEEPEHCLFILVTVYASCYRTGKFPAAATFMSDLHGLGLAERIWLADAVEEFFDRAVGWQRMSVNAWCRICVAAKSMGVFSLPASFR